MRVFSPVLFLSLGGIAVSQSINTLPTCPLTILQNLYSTTGCTDFDFACLCSDSSFISQAANLINVRCTVTDKIQAFVIVNQLCGFAGISVSVPAPPSTTSSASSTSSSSTRATTSSSSASRTSSTSSSATSSSSTASPASISSSSGPSRTASEAASSSTSAAPAVSHHGGLSNGAKIGIIIGSILGFLLLLGLIACCCLCLRRRRRRRASERGLSPESIDHEKSPWGEGEGYPHPSESAYVGTAGGVGAGTAINHMDHPAYRSDSLGSGRYPQETAPQYGGNGYNRSPQVGNFSRPGVVSPTHRGEHAIAGAGVGAAAAGGAAALSSNPARSSHGSQSGLLHNHNRGPSQGSQNGMYNSPRGSQYNSPRGSQYIPENEPPPPRFSQISQHRPRTSRGTVDYYEDVGQYPH